MSLSRVRVIILSIVSLGLIFAFIWYLYLNQDKYEDLFRASPLSAGILFMLTPLTMLIDAGISISVFENFGVKISFRDAVLLSGVSA